jgi:hypothetical protein
MPNELNKLNNSAILAFDKSVGEVLNNQFFAYGAKIFFVLYAAFMADNLPVGAAEVLNHAFVRLFIILCIAYCAKHDPVLAIIASIAFVISIQNLNRMKLSALNTQAQYQMVPSYENFTTPQNHGITSDFMGSTDTPTHTQHHTQPHTQPDVDSFADYQTIPSDSQPTADYDGGMVPQQGSAGECTGAFFTSNEELADAQNNDIPLSSENAEVKTWTNQLGPQGTANVPFGYNLDSGDAPAQF